MEEQSGYGMKPFLTTEEYAYLCETHGTMMLRALKGQLLNVIEGCGLPEKQEVAIKRLTTNELYAIHNSFVQLMKDLRSNPNEPCNNGFLITE